MKNNKGLTDKLMDIARWYAMPADHFNVVKEAVKMLEHDAPSVNCSGNPNRRGDAISREETLTAFADYAGSGMSMNDYDALWDIVVKMPPVTPQPKIGKWIKSQDSYGNNHFTCPFCEHDIATKADTLGDNYCSNCGAKMQEVEDENIRA